MVLREYVRPPSAKAFMARALLPKRRALVLPPLELRLGPLAVPEHDYAEYLALTGLTDGPLLPISWPQVWGFRLQMALLTDPAFPLPIWSALQVRNRLLQYAPLPRAARYGLSVTPAALRRLDKGVEVDLLTTLRQGDALTWQSVTTFYWRGHKGQAAPPNGAAPSRPTPAEASQPAALEAASPGVVGAALAQWGSGFGAGWRFGGLTGDYNGIHWNDRYARVFGFKRAFHHPPRVAGQCLAHLGVVREAPQQSLDLWIKGPVFYRSQLELLACEEAGARIFGLHVDGDSRPALVGRWRADTGA